MSRPILIVMSGLGVSAVLLIAWLLQRPTGSGTPSTLDHSRPRPQGGHYVSIYPRAPRQLNPFTSVDLFERRCILRFTHDSLMQIDAGTGDLVPGLVRLVEQDANGRRFVLELRDDARFSNGDDVTIEDLLFTWQASRATGLRLGSVGDAMQRIEAVSAVTDRRLQLQLVSSYFDALTRVVTDYPILQKRYVLACLRDLAAAQRQPAPVRPSDPGFGELLSLVDLPGPGTGPYRFAAGQRIEDIETGFQIEQNPWSWHRRAEPESWNLATYRFRFMGKEGWFAELRAGRADWWPFEDGPDLLQRYPEIARDYALHDYDKLSLGHHMVIWNHRRKPTADARVRRALTMLFDRQQIVSRLFLGRAAVASTWFKPPRFPERPALPFDIAAARHLLQEAGVLRSDGPPPRIEILTAHGQSIHRRILELAQESFRTAGLDLQVRELDFALLRTRRAAGEFDGCMSLWSHDDQPEIDPYYFFHSSQAGGQGQNYMGYANVEVDELLRAAREQRDPEARKQLYARFDEIFHRDQPVTLLVRPRNIMLLHRRFRAVTVGPLGLWPARWWIAAEDRRR